MSDLRTTTTIGIPTRTITMVGMSREITALILGRTPTLKVKGTITDGMPKIMGLLLAGTFLTSRTKAKTSSGALTKITMLHRIIGQVAVVGTEAIINKTITLRATIKIQPLKAGEERRRITTGLGQINRRLERREQLRDLEMYRARAIFQVPGFRRNPGKSHPPKRQSALT